MTIAHLGDLHFGRLAEPEVVCALFDDVRSLQPDLVAISGDLTQRARVREFRRARSYLRAFGQPCLVVPGNHDVAAWWHPFDRLFRPLARYRKFITDDLTPTFVKDGVRVLGVSSAYGLTVQGGRVETPERIREWFEGNKGEFRILVVHHPLMQFEGVRRQDVAQNGQEALEAGADLVLSGHRHVARVHEVGLPDGRRVVVSLTGTATSDRWRAPQAYENRYQVVRIGREEFSIEERLFDSGTFRPAGRSIFERTVLS